MALTPVSGEAQRVCVTHRANSNGTPHAWWARTPASGSAGFSRTVPRVAVGARP
jgi:hypothetical protein